MKSRLTASIDYSSVNQVEASADKIEIEKIIEEGEEIARRIIKTMMQMIPKFHMGSIITDEVDFSTQIVWTISLKSGDRPWTYISCLSPTREPNQLQFSYDTSQYHFIYTNSFDEQNLTAISLTDAQLVFWDRTDSYGTYNAYVLQINAGGNVQIGDQTNLIPLDQDSLLLIGCPGDYAVIRVYLSDGTSAIQPNQSQVAQLIFADGSTQWVSAESDGSLRIPMNGDWLGVSFSLGSGGVGGYIVIEADQNNSNPVFFEGIMASAVY